MALLSETITPSNLLKESDIKTVNGLSIVGSGNLDISGGLSPKYVNNTYAATSGEYLYTDTSSGSFGVTLPSSPNENDKLVITDTKGSFYTNNLSLLPNGSTIQGESNSLSVNISNVELTLVFYNSTWNAFVKKNEEWKNTGGIRILGSSTGNEGEELRLVIEGWSSSASYGIQVSGGSFTRSADTIYWTLPTVTQDETHYLELEQFYINTSLVIYDVQVFNISTLGDDSISISDFSNNTLNDGWII